MLILNFKNYKESTEENAEKLLLIINEVITEYPEYKDKIMVAASILDIVTLKNEFPKINIISQHVENKIEQNTTGWLTSENLLDNGIQYSLYNHSEHRVWSENIVDDIKKIQSSKLNLIVCCENLDEAAIILDANPFAIAYEPKDLIGTDISVTTRPEIIKQFTDLTSNKTLSLIGAGIKTTEDIRTGISLGTKGFLLSSGFVKSDDPKSKLIEFLQAFPSPK